MEKRNQRSYTAEYRRDAVALAQEIGASRAARQLGIPADTLYTWISRAKQGSLPQSPIPAQPKESLQLAERLKLAEQEVRALKAENAQLRKEREILEGATAFFASRQKR